MREAVFYCLKRNTLIAVGFFTVILIIDAFITDAGFRLFSYYGFIPGLILTSIVIGISGSYLNQILKSSVTGGEEPPVWELEEADVQGLINALMPFIITAAEASLLAFTVFPIFIAVGRDFSFFMSKVFFVCAAIFFSLLFPVNHLNYCVVRGFNFTYVLSVLKRKSILKIFTFFPVAVFLLILILFVSLRREAFIFVFLTSPVVFFASMVHSRALGKMFHEDNLDAE